MNHPLQIVLLADIFEWMGFILAIVALIGWVIRQIADANKAAPPAGRGRQPIAAPPRPQAAAGGVPKGGEQADPLRNQVEEFLRRAGRAPQANQPGAQRPRQPAAANEIELLIDDEPAPAEARRLSEPLRSREMGTPGMPQPAVPREPLAKTAKQRQRRPIAPPKRETLAERAAQREGERARKLGKQAAQLGQRIVAEDEQFDVQLQAKFDHSVGTLAGGTPAAAEQPAAKTVSPAAQIAAMLASPDGVRQAVVLNEILRRPSDRW